MSINPIDLILGILLGYGFIQGFRKGFLIEVASLAALLLGLWGAFLFADWVQILMSSFFTINPILSNAMAYFIVFVGIVVAISWVAKVITKVINMVSLGLFNRFLGSILGGVKIGVFLSALLLSIHRINLLVTLLDPTLLEESVLYFPIYEMGGLIFDWVVGLDSTGLQDSFI